MAAAPAWAQAPRTPDVPEIGQISKDSVWVPTPERMIRRMLQLADVTRDDVVVDLGSGDGRIPIHAAKHFGARAIGVELEENLIRLSERTARAEGVAERALFVKQDLFDFDLSVATVVALYISPPVMQKLRPVFERLKPGTRIVSHHFTLGDWEPDEEVKVEGRHGYLWVVPAQVGGAWSVRSGNDLLRLTFRQDGKHLSMSGERAGRAVIVVAPKLRGTEITFTAFDLDGTARHYRGRVEGGRMSGASDGHGIAPGAWTAVRD